MRIVVVQPPHEHLAGAGMPEPDRGSPLAVGALQWFDPKPALTVIVKATFDLGAEALALAAQQEPISGDLVRDAPWQADELYYASDFVPFKPHADVLLVGHAYAEPGHPTTLVEARVALDNWQRSFAAVVSEPSAKIPLAEAYLRSSAGHPLGPVGPLARAVADVERHQHADDTGYGLYNVAPGAQRTELFERATTLELRGLSPRGERSLSLPAWSPRALVSFRGAMPDDDVPLLADTIWIDTDLERCVIVWRGQSVLPVRNSVDRITVSLESPDERRPWDEITRPAARGFFAFAATLDDLATEPRNEAEEHALAMARYEAMAGPRAADPTISIEQYATLSAELAEQRESRAAVLARHDLDENRWLVEERGWLERMADRAAAGDGTLVARYGELFVAAQDRLGSEAEADFALVDYAETCVALETSESPAQELEQRKLTLAAWLRLDRRFRRRLAADRAMSNDFERLVREQRAARAARTAAEEAERARTPSSAGPSKG